MTKNNKIQEILRKKNRNIDNSQDEYQENTSQSVNDDNDSANNDIENSIKKEDYDAAIHEIARLKDEVLRGRAEIDNLHKRYAKSTDDAEKYAVTKFARDLVEVLENLYRAKSYIKAPEQKNDDLDIKNVENIDNDKSIQSLVDGLEMNIKLFEEVLKKNGMTRVYPVGEAFNHDYHQAISHVESEFVESGFVVEVIQAGYKIHDRLLRPALVIVAN